MTRLNVRPIDRLILLQSMAKRNPRAVERAITALRSRGLNGLGATDTDAVVTAVKEPDWFDRVLQAMQAAGAYMTSRDLSKVNLERAKQGLEPISADSIAPQMQFGLSPETRTLIKYSVLGLGGILLFTALKRR